MTPVTLNLDIQFPDRMFELKFAVGTQPLVRIYLKANGAAVTTTGYTAQMVYAEFKDSDQAVYIDSTATGATYIDFQLAATESLQISSGTEKYFLQFIVTDDTGHTVEWNRGTLTLRASPGTDGADPATLGTSLNFAGFSGYSNTGASGPYRAGTNVTFSTNGDGSANINAATGQPSDGDKGDVTVSGTGATWTIDAGAVTTAKIADDAVTADKLANTAVTAGSYTTASVTVDAQGRLTSASSGAACLPLTGGTMLGNVTFANGSLALDDDINAGGGHVTAAQFNGSGSGLTNLDATDLTGDIPAASFGSLTIEASARDMVMTTTAEVGWTGYEVDNATRTFSSDAVTSANTSAQTFVMRTLPLKVPRGFVAFKTTGAIVIEWIADDTAVCDITGIELIGYSDMTGSKTTLYTDSTVRNVGTINVPSVVSIDRSAFSSTTVPTHLVLEITGTVEDGKKMAILHMEVVGE